MNRHYCIGSVSDFYHGSAQLKQVACSDARSSEYYLVRSCLCYIHVVVKLNWEFSSTTRLYSQWLKRVVQLNWQHYYIIPVSDTYQESYT